ncbi:hypothetical protein EDD21DRAFT_129722 [Dissophora ornata]|nr:hypothetical protein EDD21DRAFT_129722 [Dissophora ornata]
MFELFFLLLFFFFTIQTAFPLTRPCPSLLSLSLSLFFLHPSPHSCKKKPPSLDYHVVRRLNPFIPCVFFLLYSLILVDLIASYPLRGFSWLPSFLAYKRTYPLYPLAR